MDRPGISYESEVIMDEDQELTEEQEELIFKILLADLEGH